MEDIKGELILRRVTVEKDRVSYALRPDLNNGKGFEEEPEPIRAIQY